MTAASSAREGRPQPVEESQAVRRRARRAAGPAHTDAAGVVLSPRAMRWSREDSGSWLPAPAADDDKYRRGVLGVRTGSNAYPGAAVLGVSAAWRTGIGMVRYAPAREAADSAHGLPSPAAAVLAAHPETVVGAPRPDGPGCDAWLLGSGTDPDQRSAEERAALLELLRGDAPLVLDAGALDLALERTRSAPAILTPHRGEFARLWRAVGFGDRPDGWPSRERRDRSPAETALVDAAARLARELDATVLLKGSMTVTATPGGQALISGPATPWLATAGTGDVLGGALAALVAGHAAAVREDPELLGAIGASAAVLHDAAARLAAGEPETGRPITAGDVATALPAAHAELRALPPRGGRAHR